MGWTELLKYVPVPELGGFFRVLGREEVPFLISYIFLAVFIVLVLWMRGRLLPLNVSVEQAYSQLVRGKTTDDFAEQYEEFANWISDNRHLKESWREFDETLIVDEAATRGIQNTARPESYFDNDALCEKVAPIRLFQAVPGYFVTIGLIFTFLGLLAALYSAKGTVSAGGIEESQKALAALLGAATLKFMTSLVGLFFSICFAVWFRALMSKLSSNMERFNSALEERLTFAAIAEIAQRSHAELELQTSQLQRFNTDFAISVADALESKLTVGIANAMAPISSALSGLSDKIGNVNEGAIRDMVNEFQGTLRGSIDSQMKDLVGVLEESRASVQGLAGIVDGAGSSISERLAETSDTLADTFSKAGEEAGSKFSAKIGEAGNVLTGMSEDFQKAAEHVSEGLTVAGGKAGEEFATRVEAAGESLSSAVEPFGKHLEEVTKTLVVLDQRLGQQSENLAPLLVSMDKITGELTATASHMEASSKPLEGVATGLAEGAEQVREAVSEIGGINDNITAVSDTLKSASEQLTRLWDDYSGRFAGVDAQMVNSFQEIVSGLQKYREEVSRMITELDSSMSRATGSLGSAIQAMQESIEEYGDMLPREDGDDN